MSCPKRIDKRKIVDQQICLLKRQVAQLQTQSKPVHQELPIVATIRVNVSTILRGGKAQSFEETCNAVPRNGNKSSKQS